MRGGNDPEVSRKRGAEEAEEEMGGEEGWMWDRHIHFLWAISPERNTGRRKWAADKGKCVSLRFGQLWIGQEEFREEDDTDESSMLPLCFYLGSETLAGVIDHIWHHCLSPSLMWGLKKPLYDRYYQRKYISNMKSECFPSHWAPVCCWCRLNMLPKPPEQGGCGSRRNLWLTHCFIVMEDEVVNFPTGAPWIQDVNQGSDSKWKRSCQRLLAVGSESSHLHELDRLPPPHPDSQTRSFLITDNIFLPCIR